MTVINQKELENLYDLQQKGEWQAIQENQSRNGECIPNTIQNMDSKKGI